MKAKYGWLLGVAALLLALDQGTKIWARTLGPRGRVEVVPGWFDFVLAENPGAAFSAMAGHDNRLVIFHAFTVLACLLLASLARALHDDETGKAAMVGVILSGVLGNWIDRLQKGTVTDFMKLYAGPPDAKAWFVERFGTNVWPIFNVADMALLFGIGLFLLQTVLEKDGTTTAEGSAPRLDDDVGAPPPLDERS